MRKQPSEHLTSLLDLKGVSCGDALSCACRCSTSWTQNQSELEHFALTNSRESVILTLIRHMQLQERQLNFCLCCEHALLSCQGAMTRVVAPIWSLFDRF